MTVLLCSRVHIESVRICRGSNGAFAVGTPWLSVRIWDFSPAQPWAVLPELLFQAHEKLLKDFRHTHRSSFSSSNTESLSGSVPSSGASCGFHPYFLDSVLGWGRVSWESRLAYEEYGYPQRLQWNHQLDNGRSHTALVKRPSRRRHVTGFDLYFH